MENTVSGFIRELLSSGGIPYHCVTPPCQDWDWIDLGLRGGLLGMKERSPIMNRYFENLKKETLYHYADFFQLNYSVFPLPEESGEGVFGRDVPGELVFPRPKTA